MIVFESILLLTIVCARVVTSLCLRGNVGGMPCICYQSLLCWVIQPCSSCSYLGLEKESPWPRGIFQKLQQLVPVLGKQFGGEEKTSEEKQKETRKQRTRKEKTQLRKKKAA